MGVWPGQQPWRAGEGTGGGLPVLGVGTAANSPEIPGVGMGKELGGAELSLSLQAAGELCPQQRGEMLLWGSPVGWHVPSSGPIMGCV